MSDDDGIHGTAFPYSPSPHSPGQGRAEEGDLMENGEGDGDVSKLAEVPAAKRKGVKRPQPKLDSQRLISDRGLPALRTLFDNVHFKGKGHEAEDLRLLMQKMENWAHRLFPKLQFEEFIDKVERLGKKKEVQTCLKRIRLDMPLTHEDYSSQTVEDEILPEPHVVSNPDPFDGLGFSDDLPGLIHSTPAAAAPAAPSAPSLTEEQQRRMELNRQRALERKLSRQQQHADGSDLQPVEEFESIGSEHLDESGPPAQEAGQLNPEPSTQLSQAESEPAAPSPRCEEEEESSVGPVQRPSSCGEDGLTGSMLN
eukprot:XP_011608100.1 PREDICTED: TIMELESS-interacting protein [Takifugu rubripes]